MAFSDFTLETIAKSLGVTTRDAVLFLGPIPAVVEVPAWLRDSSEEADAAFTDQREGQERILSSCRS